VITCLITEKPFPREFRVFAISKIFINHVRIASLGGEISHVLVTSWGTGPICVGPHHGVQHGGEYEGLHDGDGQVHDGPASRVLENKHSTESNGRKTLGLFCSRIPLSQFSRVPRMAVSASRI